MSKRGSVMRTLLSFTVLHCAAGLLATFSAQAASAVRVGTSSAVVNDSKGDAWEAASGFIGGWFWGGNAGDIATTTDDVLYRPEWAGMRGWSRTLPNGTYTVTLKMRESWFSTAGARVFSVSAEGKQVLRDIDIVAATGKNTAYDRSFTVTVNDGRLDLGFSATANLPVVSAIRVRPAAGPLYNTLLPGRQLWAHMVPHGLPDYVEGNGASTYGSIYPLDLVAGDWRAPKRPGAGVPRAQAAGLTGMQILQFDWANKGSDFMGEWMDQADPTWTDADPNNDFSIAPCILITQPGSFERMVAEYAAFVKNRPSAARVGGKLIIYAYWPRNITPVQWGQARQKIIQNGLQIFLIGDLATDSSQYARHVPNAVIDPYVPYFDAVWNFDDGIDQIWPELLEYLHSRKLAYAGGAMPGYDRETTQSGGLVPAQGTGKFRRELQYSLDSGAPWITIVTWNDMVERTDIKPSSDWNLTRSDIAAFYGALLRNLPFPRPWAELYVTTPDFIRLGEPVYAEGLVLNGGSPDVTVHTRIVDRYGNQIGGVISQQAAIGEATDATTPQSARIATMPAGRFVRAHTWPTDAAGRMLQSVYSAPVLIYDSGQIATPMMRQHYYSIPARKGLPNPPSLRLEGTPVLSPGAQAVVAAPLGTHARFTELLQNTRQVKLAFNSEQLIEPIPMRPRAIIGGQVVSAKPWGFYLARVIDEQERVGYSDPVYVPMQ